MYYILLIISIALTTCGQIFQKLGAAKIKANLKMQRGLISSALNLYIFLGFLSLGLGAFLWLIVLSKMELSLAYPMLSLGYVLVTLISKFFFKEEIPRSRWIGVAIIMFGIILISRT